MRARMSYLLTDNAGFVMSPRLLAALPMSLLCAFWVAGEVALIAAALIAPALAIWIGISMRRSVLAGARDTLSSLLSRDEMLLWLNGASGKRTPRNAHLAVMSLVIDDMNSLEQRFGQDAARFVHREIVRRLQNALRHEDAVASTDDNLIVLGLAGITAPETENLLKLARRLQSVCDDPFTYQKSRIYCTISLGLAGELHLKNATAATLLHAAETAGGFAASSGPGSVRIFSEGLISEKDDEREYARSVSNALETGEIFAWFQPQMSTDARRIIGFEALARWEHPDKGLILPGEFLPDIGRAGLSQRLAEVVLKQSLTALNAWDAAGFDVPCVSVNFSGEDLRNPRLADYVMWELDRFGLGPQRLVIEVLESVIAEKHETAITRTLKSLSDAGCRIDLDDFGTGSTSILNIRRFNVSRIKIDRRLVSGLDTDAEQRRMVAALLSFSSKLGIAALAEGVETEQERDVLHELGCTNVQGYAIARPMPLGETLLWLDRASQTASDQAGIAASA